jgi:hypothetical protein
MRLTGVLLLLAAAPACAKAQNLQWHGYLDYRLVAGSSAPNWTDGGLGKLRWDGHGVSARFGGAALLATAQLSPELLGVASTQFQTSDRRGIDLTEAWLRYRPVSITPWRWSLRGGLFFPAVSLENDGIGWTSPYTLTPSAINSWVGEELRSTGAEFRLERRGRAMSVEAAVTAFVGNDPAGEQLAARGWSLSDLVYGLGSSMREPDLAARDGPPPRRYDAFVETDHRVGWQGELTVRADNVSRLTLLHYDNRADPTTSTMFEGQRIFSWHTRFWSLGERTRIGDWVLIGQAIRGSTAIVPSPFFHTETGFWSAFAMVAREQGRWRPALRVEMFGTRQRPDSLAERANEHGRALTAALNWQPRSWLRVTAELIALDSSRTERRQLGLAESSFDLQAQLGARLVF